MHQLYIPLQQKLQILYNSWHTTAAANQNDLLQLLQGYLRILQHPLQRFLHAL